MQRTHWPSTGAFKRIVDLNTAAPTALAKCAAWPDGKETSVFRNVSLREERKNQYGNTPVSVFLEETNIGGLSRFHIDDYHQVASQAGVQGQETTAHAKVTCFKTANGERKFSIGIDINFKLPPGTVGSRKRRPTTDYQVPYFHSMGYLRGGYLVFFVEGVDAETVEKCTPGREVDCWSPEGSEDVYLYAEGSVGGSGKILTTDTADLAKCGFLNLDDFRPVVHSASGDIVIISAKAPTTS